MSESHEALRERLIVAGVEFIESGRRIFAAEEAASLACQQLAETKALIEAIEARQRASEALNEATAATLDFPISEQIEIANHVADRAGTDRVPFEQAFAMLRPEERERYNEELAALDAAAQA